MDRTFPENENTVLLVQFSLFDLLYISVDLHEIGVNSKNNQLLHHSDQFIKKDKWRNICAFFDLTLDSQVFHNLFG